MKDGKGANDDNGNNVDVDNNYNDDDDSAPLAKVTPIWIAFTVEISADPTFMFIIFSTG